HTVLGTRRWHPASGNPPDQLVRSPSPGATSLTLAIEKTPVVSLGNRATPALSRARDSVRCYEELAGASCVGVRHCDSMFPPREAPSYSACGAKRNPD